MFEDELRKLIEQSEHIKRPANATMSGVDLAEYNRPSEVWMNDVQIFYDKYLKEHELVELM